MTARSEGLGGRQTTWTAGPAIEHAPNVSLRSAPTGLVGIGAALREARESRQISFEAAERDTHIPRHHLQALEEERFEAFHAPVYVRGFLRSYSQYLKLDSSELLALLPADRPVEDERLMPVSRLGRPRGPREAAMERRDPAARDAAPLTSPHPPGPASGTHSERRGRDVLTGAGVQTLEPSSRVVPRLDPLGRLGWPESPKDVQLQDEAAEPPPRRRGSFSKVSWEQPLSPRRSRNWDAPSRSRGVLPEDARALSGLKFPLALAGGVCVLALLWGLMHALGGIDTSPAVLATAGPDATVKIPAGTSQLSAHGPMPNLLGSDLTSALAALRKSGVTPVVVAESGGDPAGLPVTAQVPSPGSELRPETAVLVVVGGGS